MNPSHQSLVASQFGAHADAYLASETHARGADLDCLAARVGAMPPGRVLDLGCGGGHIGFTVAPLIREVVAYDLSPDMLAPVRGEAAASSTSRPRAAQRRQCPSTMPALRSSQTSPLRSTR